jgi:predicted dipeptidase
VGDLPPPGGIVHVHVHVHVHAPVPGLRGIVAKLLALALGCWACGKAAPKDAGTPPSADRALPAADAASPGAPERVAVVRRDLAENGREAVVALATQLVRFQTVSAIAPPAQHEGFAGLAAFLRTWAEDLGLGFRVVGEHDAYEIVLPGRTDRGALVFITHADVVAVNDPPSLIAPGAVPEGWTGPPFAAEVRDGRLYGRGVEDDKGPIAAAMVVLRAMKLGGLRPDVPIVLAMGTGEEHDWDGMKRYAEKASPDARYVSLDASFPIVVAEDGFVAWGLRVPLEAAPAGGSKAVAVHVDAGFLLTQVPDRAELWLRPGAETIAALLARAAEACSGEIAARGASSGFSCEAEIAEREGERLVVVRARGRSVHSSTPEGGANALWLLSAVARQLDPAPGAIRTLLGVVAEFFDGDHYGEKLGLAYADPLMGPLVAAPTILRVEDGAAELEINMRRPAGRTADEFRAGLDALVVRLRERFGGSVAPFVGDDVYVGDPHTVDADGPLARTLIDVYRSVAADPDAGPVAMRGGSYARLFPGAVSFGPCLPGEPYRGHGADEYIDVAALELSVRAIYEAIVRLAFGE